MTISNIAELISGVTLFLFGMCLMGDSLKQVAGSKLEIILYRLTGSPLKGALFGAGVTAIIQSSSATSVMVIGFVNAQVMSVKQATSVMLGAILGTSATGWVLCLSDIGSTSGIMELFSTEMITCIAALVGIVLVMFFKRLQDHHIGSVLLGFAILMVGMSAMSQSVSSLREDANFIRMLTRFSNPIIGIFVGAVFTAVLQSASASVGILQALSVSGTITFNVAFPLILGISIGAAVPVILAAVNTSAKGKRTAFFYLLASIVSVTIIAILFYIVNAVFSLSIMRYTMSSTRIALLNTVFRFIIVLILLPMIPWFEAVLARLFPDSREKNKACGKLNVLQENITHNTTLAIEQCRIAVEDMLNNTRENLSRSFTLNQNFTKKVYDDIYEAEDLVDAYEDRLNSYILRVAQNELNQKQGSEIAKYLHTITDFERLSDHSVNLAELAKKKSEDNIVLSETAQKDLSIVQYAVNEIINLSFDAYLINDFAPSAQVEALGMVIASLCGEIRLRHMQRLEESQCTMEAGFYLNDVLGNFKRIADHCSNISIGMISVRLGSFDTHEYQDRLRSFKNGNCKTFYAQYLAQYALN